MTVDELLHGTQALVQEAGEALLSGEATEFERCSSVLRDAATALQRIVHPGAPAMTGAQAQHLQALTDQLSQLRTQMARLAALADRQLASVLASTAQPPTYGSGFGTDIRLHRTAS